MFICIYGFVVEKCEDTDFKKYLSHWSSPCCQSRIEIEVQGGKQYLLTLVHQSDFQTPV